MLSNLYFPHWRTLSTSTIVVERSSSSPVSRVVLKSTGAATHDPGTDIVELLDVKVLPYVIFLVVPILGRMSDSDDDVRLVATNTFATLIKLVPLEVGD